MKFGKFIAALISALMMLACSAAVSASSAGGSRDTAANIPEKYLAGRELELYRRIRENLISISEGKQDAKAFYINVSSPFADKKEYEKAVEKAMFFISHYSPEYFYWVDSSGFLVYDSTRCGVVYGISPAYRMPGNKDRISSGRSYDINRAFINAKEIADKYQDKGDYEKVIGYAEEICRLNTYNKEADENEGYSQKNIDPWRIIYVFDRNPETNVVCAGYAEAFQYLCSLGGVECHYVTGQIKEGYHAWNIVVIDGENYFVDLTACDTQPESVIEMLHPFVMNSVRASSGNEFSTFFSYGGSIYTNVYKYEDSEIEYLPESLRKISTKAYSNGGSAVVIVIVVILIIGAAVFIIKRRRKRDEYY